MWLLNQTTGTFFSKVLVKVHVAFVLVRIEQCLQSTETKVQQGAKPLDYECKDYLPSQLSFELAKCRSNLLTTLHFSFPVCQMVPV